MNNNMKTTTLKGWGSLEYVTITKVPIRHSVKHGDIIAISPFELERLVAIALIEKRVPICGQELKLLKSAIGISFAEIASRIGVSKNSLVNWCKKKDKRLSIVHEIAMRVLASEILGVKLKATLDDLVADSEEKDLIIQAA